MEQRTEFSYLVARPQFEGRSSWLFAFYYSLLYMILAWRLTGKGTSSTDRKEIKWSSLDRSVGLYSDELVQVLLNVKTLSTTEAQQRIKIYKQHLVCLLLSDIKLNLPKGYKLSLKIFECRIFYSDADAHFSGTTVEMGLRNRHLTWSDGCLVDCQIILYLGLF